jgi:hypothetical protein
VVRRCPRLCRRARSSRCVDISSNAIAFVRGARVVRVTHSPGGYRLAATFEALDSACRAMLGRFVVILMRAQAA